MLNSIIDLSERVEGGEKERVSRGWERGRDGGEERMSQKQRVGSGSRRVGRVLLFHFTFITETVEY